MVWKTQKVFVPLWCQKFNIPFDLFQMQVLRFTIVDKATGEKKNAPYVLWPFKDLPDGLIQDIAQITQLNVFSKYILTDHFGNVYKGGEDSEEGYLSLQEKILYIFDAFAKNDIQDADLCDNAGIEWFKIELVDMTNVVNGRALNLESDEAVTYQDFFGNDGTIWQVNEYSYFEMVNFHYLGKYIVAENVKDIDNGGNESKPVFVLETTGKEAQDIELMEIITSSLFYNPENKLSN